MDTYGVQCIFNQHVSHAPWNHAPSQVEYTMDDDGKGKPADIDDEEEEGYSSAGYSSAVHTDEGGATTEEDGGDTEPEDEG